MKKLLLLLTLFGALSLKAEIHIVNPSGGGSSSVSIGSAISGLTAGNVLFGGPLGILAQDNDLAWNSTTNNLSGPAILTGNGTSLTVERSPGSMDLALSFVGGQTRADFIGNSVTSSGGTPSLPGFGFPTAATKGVGMNLFGTNGLSWTAGATPTFMMYLTTTGLGIGTSAPATKLHVSSGVLTIDGTGAGLNVVGTSSATYFVGDGSLLTNIPGGGGDMLLGTVQTVTAAKTFSAPTVFTASATMNNSTTSPALKINQTGNVGTSDGTGGAFVVDMTSQTGNGIQIYTNRDTGTQLTGMLYLRSGATSYDEPMIYLKSDSTGSIGGNADMRMDSNNPDLEFVETDQVAPAGKFEIAVQNDVLQLNARNAANTSFQQYISMSHAGALRFKEGDNGGDFLSFIPPNTLSGSTSWILPGSDLNGYLKSDGSGNLSFSAAGDSLGNHTATTTLNMAGFGITNVSSITFTGASAPVISSTFSNVTFITSADSGVTNSTWTLYTTSATLAQGGSTTVATYLGSDIDLSGAEATGVLAAARFPALTGDITNSAGALATVLTSTITGPHYWTGGETNTSASGILIQGAATSSQSSTLAVLSTAPANGTAGGGLIQVGRSGVGAISGSEMSQIQFTAGDGSASNKAGATITAKAAGTWNTGSYRSHLIFATAISGSVDAESGDFAIADTGQVTIGTTTISAFVPTGTGLLTLGARGDMPAIAMTGFAGEPTGLVDGGIYYNTTQKALRYRVQGTTESFVGATWTKTVSSTVTATTTETDLLGTGFGTLLVPANFWTVGKSIKVHLEGLISDDAATPGTHLFNVKLDAVSVAATAANTPTVGLTNKHWDMDVVLTCRSTGGSGKVVGAGSFRYENTLAAGFWGMTQPESSIATVDTTQADTLSVNLTNGTNDSDNIFVTQVATVEVLN